MKNRQAANHSTGFTGTAAMIGWFAVFFLVLKLGGTSEINHPVYVAFYMVESDQMWPM